MKTISIRQMAAIKASAKIISPLVVKRDKLVDKMTVLKAEYDAITAQINAYDAGTIAMTGGYTSEQLVDRIVEGTGKLDANGHEIKITKYVPKENVVYDEANKVYTIIENTTIDVSDDKVEIDMVEDTTFDPTSAAENGFEDYEPKCGDNSEL